ncbi:protein-methionine-sulfoxide reductase heme-binding subunit MsrQ [Sulfitobacter sp. D35]|uniref:protein-methionine-sulfoxide reductase heme-binding subunit MsrQ n=1 Tax=Sulfitobacter sp. D35 TaxID=3083252 RepID=UPI00296E8442|nr:protein-methionine-sulfoxide reductase heme-binding subunit MsrQ [Sulfitobacter sp. D35]MDW4500068.1 protein-methionine-sulfoxide reductase heme-binding subunit MsrQ [Sulfitobacter sp. D35]
MTVTERINSGARRLPTWPVYLLCLLPVPWWVWQAQIGGLGREPIEALEHLLGETALQLLIAGLCVTPLRRYLGINLIRFRRALGLLAFTYVCLHLLVWVVLDLSLLWQQMWVDILKRPYITIGMAGFLCLVPLAATSNAASVRRLGAAGWQKLHRLTYPAILLGAIHYVMLAKGFQIEPLAYLVAILGLLALRIPGSRRKRAV